MIFVHDTRDRPDKHRNVDDYLLKQGHSIVRTKMYVGDMTLLSDQSVCIDFKRDLQEVCGNLCQQHDRFRAELERAQAAGIKLIMLVEHGGRITSLDSVMGWTNPRLKTSPYAVSGEKLHKIMVTIAAKYGVEWRFCQKRNTGKEICQILGIETKEGESD